MNPLENIVCNMESLIEFLKADANAANALGAVASAIAAFFALFVSIISLIVSVRTLSVQRKHNALSVRPLAEVTVADYENSLRVKVRNNGSGPMIIKVITVGDGNSTKESLIDWMPQLPTGRPWTTFSHSLRNRSLLPAAEIVLLELTEVTGEVEFSLCRNSVREALSILTVNVEYSDIYNSSMDPQIKPLTWFGRHTTVGK
jgi:hypothetical protein